MYKKVIPATLASILLFSTVSPSFSSAKEIKNDTVEKSVYSNTKQLDLILVEKELKAAGLTSEDIAQGLANEFANRGYSSVSKIETSEYTPSGIKSKAAKEAAKLMLKKIKGIGEKAWNGIVKEYINKLPVPSSVKKTLIAYTSYQIVMETLNVVIDFEGDITDDIQDYLMSKGFNSFFAGLIARTLVLLLL